MLTDFSDFHSFEYIESLKFLTLILISSNEA